MVTHTSPFILFFLLDDKKNITWLFLLGLGYHLPVKTTKEQVTYYATPHLRDFSLKNFPIWIAYDGAGKETTGEYYGFPVYGEMGTKAGMHLGGKEVDPDKR